MVRVDRKMKKRRIKYLEIMSMKRLNRTAGTF